MEQAKQFQSPLRKILFCTDFSENADFAFDFAIDAAVRRPGCELHLLHVVPESDAQFWKSYMYEVEDVDNQAKRDIDASTAAWFRKTFHLLLNIVLGLIPAKFWITPNKTKLTLSC
jgi:hypothetical protein